MRKDHQSIVFVLFSVTSNPSIFEEKRRTLISGNNRNIE